MNKKLMGLVFGLVIIVSSILLFSVLTEDSKDVSDENDQDYTTEDILNEVDENLLEEDDEIEIGEMV